MQASISVMTTKSNRPAIGPEPPNFTQIIALQKSLTEIREKRWLCSPTQVSLELG